MRSKTQNYYSTFFSNYFSSPKLSSLLNPHHHHHHPPPPHLASAPYSSPIMLPPIYEPTPALSLFPCPEGSVGTSVTRPLLRWRVQSRRESACPPFSKWALVLIIRHYYGVLVFFAAKIVLLNL
ncbi:hypothetical protein RND81_14G075300 [Saponaria officinalis]|uniref:Uncharacterized protein n=1 Tax=Saponaria officinalis TaxID=3572 RepID=A0AAW1GJL2_SAPOF